MKKLNIVLAAFLGLAVLSAQADTTNAEKLAKKYVGIAKSVNPEYKGTSVFDGKLFYNRKIKLGNSKETSCASCHSANPADLGKHIVTGKAIKPLSPVVNPNRFTDLDKVEDQFTQHCNDIIGTDCAAKEKADYIAYVMTEKTPTAKK
jgi:hypothetical protein